MHKTTGKTAPENLLKVLCENDTELYECLGNYLYENPQMVISKGDLGVLTEQAEQTGNFSFALDKAIFDAAQNIEEKQRYARSWQRT